MYQTNLNRRSLRSALLLGAASAAAIGLAAPATAQENVETVVVTGSRIPQQGLYSSSPVTAVGQQEMKLEGTTNVETLINNLPSAFADFTDTASNGATGQATVDLRGLGSKRTLVLVNGTRMMPSDPANPVADLNQIPAALVDHVEVLTGGASAVYGSDAEAGVVNFIMRKDFEGVELDGQYGIDEADNSNGLFAALQTAKGFAPAPRGEWDGSTTSGTLILGTNSPNDKGNVTAYLSYTNTESVLEAARDFSACSLSNSGTGHVCAGSSNYNRFISLDDYYAGAPYDLFETGTGTPGSGAYVPYTGSASQKFNYGALNYLQRPDTRYAGGFFAHYQESKALDIYSSFMFTDDHTVAQIAPSGLFLGSYEQINCNNPFLSAQEASALCGNSAFGVACTPVGSTGNCNLTPGQALVGIGRRDVEGGDRRDELRHTAFRMQIGARGDLGDGWSYDVYGQYGVTVYQENYSNEFSRRRVQNALEVDPATGKCYAAEPNSIGLVSDPACVPLNIFDGFGGITPQALKYVEAQGFKEGYTAEQILSGSITGDLGEYGIQSPWAKSPVAVSAGAEYRSESLELQTDYEFQTNDLFGQGSATLPVPRSGFDVVEGFAEVKVPVVQGQPFFEDLSLNGGYRYSSYSTAGAVSAYKYGAEWQPIDDFRLRGSYQRAVRAPNVLELFTPDNVGLFGGNDPCGPGASGTVLANCLAHGAPNAGSGLLVCPAAQCNQESGGNVNLRPEISDTKSFGIVLTPTFFDGFSATVDYFDISIAGGIGVIPPNATLQGCYGATATAASQAVTCPLVIRDPVTHSIHSTVGFVKDLNVNVGSVITKGFDFESNYQVNLDDWGMKGDGSLSVNFVGTLLDTLTTKTLSTLAPDVCAGFYASDCGTPNPKWRHKLRLTWNTPWDVDLSVDWRHFGGVTIFPTFAGDIADRTIPAFNWFDVAMNWSIREGVEMRFGVNNVFDKDPPVMDSNNFPASAPAFGNGNTYPGVYDSLGRQFFIGATIKY